MWRILLIIVVLLPSIETQECGDCNSTCLHGVCMYKCSCGSECVLGGYQCHCNQGYTGQNCESDINECLLNPCLNNGTCVNQPGGYSCQCPVAYTGINCESANLCENQECLETGSRCTDHLGVYTCLCTETPDDLICQYTVQTQLP